MKQNTRKVLFLTISAVMVAVFAQFAPVSAAIDAELTYHGDTGSISVVVTTDKKAAKAAVLVPGTDEQGNATYWVLEEFSRNVENVFSKTFLLPAECPSGSYVATVTVSGEKAELPFSHVNQTQAVNALARMNRTTKASFQTDIEETYADLAIDLQRFYTNQELLTELFFRYRPANEFTLVQFSDFYTQCLYMSEAANLASDDTLKDYLSQNRTALSFDYEAFGALTSTEQKAVLNFIRAKKYYEATPEQEFQAWICLADLNEARNGGVADYQKLILETYRNVLALNTLDYQNITNKTQVIHTVMAKEYFSLAEFRNAFYQAVSSVATQVPSVVIPSGGGGGGGGFGGGNANNTIIGAVNTLPTQNSQNAIDFSDVGDSHWCAAPIRELKERGILSGTGDNLFYPERSVTRAEFSKMLITALFEDYQMSQTAGFYDVADSAWYAKYVNIAAELGIVTGYEDAMFYPEATISRQDMSVMVYRAAKKCGIALSSAEAAFSDAEYIGDYAKEAVSNLFGSKLISGMGDGSFQPNGILSRAQAAKVLYEVLQLLVK